MSLVDESFEFNSFLGGEFVTVESESTTKIENTKNNMRFMCTSFLMSSEKTIRF